MRLTLFLRETIYDCRILITDSHGKREYYISALTNDGPSVDAEFFDDDFSLSVIPMLTDSKNILNEFESNTLIDKFAKKLAKTLMNALDTMTLRVACTYRITGCQDGDRLDISLQSYVFGTFDRFDIFELAPIMYAFFEVFDLNRRFKLTEAYETNRTSVLKFIKKFALADAFGSGILMYPIQMHRAKRLTNAKKISKTLLRFNAMDEAERERFLTKQEKYMNK